MKLSDIPAKFNIPFAADASPSYVRTVPQTTADPTAASLTLGFPPATATPIGAGGTPPSIQDINGITLQTTSWSRWQSAGGAIEYDSVFSAAIGGYPKGAILSSTPSGDFWISTVDDNVTDPDTGGAGWKRAGKPEKCHSQRHIHGHHCF